MAADNKDATTGGSFLIKEVGSAKVMAPELFSDDQKSTFKTGVQFAREQVLSKAEHLEKKDNAMWRDILLKAGELGFLMIDIPEAYGGLGLGKTTSMLVAEAMSVYASWSVTFGAHTGIGTLPITWFGTPAQKQRYLPKLATGEWVACYGLTETGSGSDALGAKTRAVLSPDKKQWVLNGSKQFITNAGFADVFIVFAKVDGEKFTAFIVEKGTPGLSVGPEEHKMGIRGSSTCSLIFEDMKIPAENLLGEIGKGHKIAFNILNLGRLKLGAGMIGGMKHHLANSLAYAQDRKQFDTPIVQFPLMREKLARMAQLTYAVETMTYRTSGCIDDLLVGADKTAKDYDTKVIAAIEELAVESSILKVFGSEAYGTLLDESVQMHGGYGFIEEYPVERAYRDQRVNRIFEGTNEINRMLITGMLLKRTVKGALPLFDFAQALDEELAKKSLPKAKGTDALAEETLATEYLKRLAVYAIKVAAEAYGPELDKRQMILAAIADIVMDVFALDSMISRTRQAAARRALDPARVAMVQSYCMGAQARSYANAQKALASSAKGADLARHLEKISALQFFIPHDPHDLVEAVVTRIESLGGYPVVA